MTFFGCCRCVDEGIPEAGSSGEERYSLGIYAGRYCDKHWEESGYRTEGPEGFDRDDAGESYEGDE